jgi:hypothetical protein
MSQVARLVLTNRASLSLLCFTVSLPLCLTVSLPLSVSLLSASVCLSPLCLGSCWFTARKNTEEVTGLFLFLSYRAQKILVGVNPTSLIISSSVIGLKKDLSQSGLTPRTVHFTLSLSASDNPIIGPFYSSSCRLIPFHNP